MRKLTYISLFSSAGVGCYGFKKAGFECIATNEIVKKRLEIQRNNNKCRYETGYINGDITDIKTKGNIINQINFWKTYQKIKEVDVIIATPPCQGMSVANHHKKDTEYERNSLVLESIELIKEIKPRFFVFENVPSFLNTICIKGNEVMRISEAMDHELSNEYNFLGKVLNFNQYGSNSSRKRTLVLGVRKDISINVEELFPKKEEEKTLREVIGNYRSLKSMNEIDEKDIYHFFRPYREDILNWIKDLKEGESAFDNYNKENRPHSIKNGVYIENQNKNADKYKRQYWDKPAKCIHTRNDCLSSQNTIHPSDNRVFSIREIMELMTIPKEFQWTVEKEEELNNLSYTKKLEFLKKHELTIRKSIGESVPTNIFYQIAINILKHNDI